jgi:hypothetical protein
MAVKVTTHVALGLVIAARALGVSAAFFGIRADAELELLAGTQSRLEDCRSTAAWPRGTSRWNCST